MDFAQLSQPSLLLLIGAIALFESLAFIGIIVPGIALLFAIALVAGEQQLALLPLLLCAFAGAVAGDGLSYCLGRHANPWLQHRWPFSAYPGWHHRGANFFRRYGLLSILAGRFIGPIRPVIPFVAGTFEMPAARFFSVNILSAALWAPANILPGYWVGQSADALLGHWQALFYPALGLLMLILAATILHQHLQPDQPLARWGAKRLGLKPERLAALLLLGVAGSGLLILCVLQYLGSAQAWNQHIQQLLWLSAEHSRPFWVFVTTLGDSASLIPAALLLAMTLHGLRRSRDGWRFVLLLLLCVALNSTLKWLFQASRPDMGLVISGFSFPSGHSSTSAAFFAMLAILLGTGHRLTWRRLGYLSALVPALLIGLSRIMVGAHWPLDVLAAWCEGLMAAAALRLWLLRPQRVPRPVQGRDICLLSAGLLFLLGALAFWQLDARLAHYQALAS
ncbi:bifunctional DedA family/phosphatase PAP2 family protein [Marinobacterium rhizophilum]|uniref:Bifunctional DedA family/phosphatase PAP2 family protein n=1 Tax=Marinobacterium rhizophilum TaxID=420402 RepID=A0ABY5HGQ4_9GAMM|nr:bifunctional DedA family/phosphatase PAP2 family protein [Marinobacterium rhizophilum]UTW11470.1 bifunctional DedA family/phosphatase PAP2 family protein [Marinobacterium rhizophilum]